MKRHIRRVAACRTLRTGVLTLLCGVLLGLSGPGHAQSPSSPQATTYEVRRGDTLFKIARQILYPKTSVWQMVLALYRANPEAFVGGSINQLPVGRVLQIPPLETVTAVEAGQAGREVQALIARPPVSVTPTAPVQPAPAPKPAATPPDAKKPAKAPALPPAQAEARYQQGLAQERQGDLKGALKAFLEAGQSGNGAAQKKLGDLYNSGNAVVQRDYETALKWYQKARDQGVEIPKPMTPGIRY